MLDEINAAGKKPVTANSRLNPNLLRQRTYPGGNLKKVVDAVRDYSRTQTLTAAVYFSQPWNIGPGRVAVQNQQTKKVDSCDRI